MLKQLELDMAHRNITVTNNNFNADLLNQLVLWIDPINPLSWPGPGLSYDKATKDIYDLTVFNNDGVLSGGSSFQYPNINYDGTAYSSISIPTSSSLEIVGNFALCAWINVKDNTDPCYIISKDVDDYAIISGFQSGYVNAYINGAYRPDAASTRIAVNNDEWTFIVYTKASFSSTENYWFGYKNAVQQFGLKPSTFTPGNDKLRLYIGNSRPGPTSGTAFNGKTGPIFIFNRYIFPNEVLYLYNTTKSRYGL